jgi:hypothetical protein
VTSGAGDGEARPASPAAVQVLRQILVAGRARNPRGLVEFEEHTRDPAQLLPEWLALARMAGVAVPPELLPEMLEFGRRWVKVRGAVAEAAGAHGQRLAATNAAWAYAAAPPADPAAAWEAGTAESRLRILRHLRRTAPAAALPLLRSTWNTETKDDRIAFLDALETGLSLDDEPLLESVLDEPIAEPDPDKLLVMRDGMPEPRKVRPTTVDLLVKLPGSRLVTRMFARLAPLLTLREPPGERARIEVRRPVPEDGEELRRYGRTPWMESMLVVVPPALWSAHWERGYAEMLQAARDIGDDDLVIRAWTEAALRVRDGEYAEARLRMPGGRHPGAGIDAVADVIPPARLEPLVLERLSAHGLAFSGTVPELLRAARFPWSPALTRAVLEALPDVLPSDDPTLLFVMSDSALYMHPATAVAVLRERDDTHQGGWVDLLHLRHTLHQAFP